MNVRAADSTSGSNIASLIAARAAEAPRPLFRQHLAGEWRDFDARTVARMAAAWQAGLHRAGMRAGDRVGICLRNGVHWVAVDTAALGMRLVVVPLYVDDNAGNIAWCARDAGCKLIVLENERQLRALQAEKLECVFVVLTGEGAAGAQRASDFLAEPEDGLRVEDVEIETLASVCYTSGTSGRPKGVMLSHANMLFDARAGLQTITLRPDETFISLLPLSHMFERTAGYYLPLMHGARIVYARGIAQFADDLATQRPTVMITVPRVLERLHARILQALRDTPSRKRLLLKAAAHGWRVASGHGSWADRAVQAVLDPLAARPVRERLGGRLYLVVAGGAAMNPSISRFFIGLGVHVLQGYGMTEASPVISVNRPERNVPESVGEPLPGVEVRVSESGELLTRGPHVMLGYWNNAPATQGAIREGWLHTGDVVERHDNRITIRGRAKDILVLSNGEKVPPQDIENSITEDPLFQQVMLVGEGRPFLTLLAVTDETDDRALVQRANDRLAAFPRYARVRRVIRVREAWTVENGLLTPTLKLKRNVVAQRYGEEIERVYEREGTA
jgi:long-chain acyl-CoA synthetase